MTHIVKVETDSALFAVEEESGTKVIPTYSPRINDNGNWEVYDDARKVYVDTGVKAKGDDGEDAKINGKNAIEIEAGEHITIEDTQNGIKINSTGGGQDPLGLKVVDGLICAVWRA